MNRLSLAALILHQPQFLKTTVPEDNTYIYRPLRLRKAIMSDNEHSPKCDEPIVSR
jgi:hypothetical protein